MPSNQGGKVRSHTFHKDHHHFGWDNSNQPKLRVAPGARVEFDTVDSSGAQLGPSEAAEAWSAAKDTASIAVLDAYVARYRHEFFAELARARIEELRQRAEPLSPP